MAPQSVRTIVTTWRKPYWKPRKKRVVEYNEGGERIWSKKTLQNRNRPRQPWHIDSKELKAMRKGPAPFPIRSQKPPEERDVGPKHLMAQLRQEEKHRVLREFPRKIEDFGAGDRIAVTRYVGLRKPKLEVVKGMCIERSGGNLLRANFKMVNIKLGEPYEFTMPINSPFITKIEVIQRGGRQVQKMRWIRDQDPGFYET